VIARAVRIALLGLLVGPGQQARPDPQAVPNPQLVMDQAVRDFEAGRIEEAAGGFDRVVMLVPDAEPILWQRGIVLYYAGRYQDCREQFELHRTVNPDDVENAVWHFMCVSRLEGPPRARELLLPVGQDPRRPMPEIYGMFAGETTPDEVLAAVEDAAEGSSARFYAALYVGLYHHVHGEDEAARRFLGEAAGDRFVRAGGGMDMNMVARVHVALDSR
jgi:lipoprotein NlpI